MKYTLSPATIEILKNFAAINPEVVFSKGIEQRTANNLKNFMADVELDAPLPVDCALYNVNKLLGIIDTCKGATLPDLEFFDTELKIVHEHGEVTLPYAHRDVVQAPPSSKYSLAREVASFDLPASLWTKITRTASVLGTTSLQFETDVNGSLRLKLLNDRDKGGDTTGWGSFTMPNTVVAAPVDTAWNVKFDSLELLTGDYKVTLGDIQTATSKTTLFGVFFKLNDPNRKVTYLTSGHAATKR